MNYKGAYFDMNTPTVRTLEESMNLSMNVRSYVEVKQGTDIAQLYSALPRGIRESILWPEDYGIKWRVWDGKATKAQRKATPWRE